MSPGIRRFAADTVARPASRVSPPGDWMVYDLRMASTTQSPADVNSALRAVNSAAAQLKEIEGKLKDLQTKLAAPKTPPPPPTPEEKKQDEVEIELDQLIQQCESAGEDLEAQAKGLQTPHNDAPAVKKEDTKNWPHADKK